MQRAHVTVPSVTAGGCSFHLCVLKALFMSCISSTIFLAGIAVVLGPATVRPSFPAHQGGDFAV